MNRLPQPPRWRVECPTRQPEIVDGLMLPDPAWSWSVRSPRGTVVFQTRDRRAALHIGRSMAAIDEMLARVNRLEKATYGDHPALRTSAQKRRVVVPMARTGW